MMEEKKEEVLPNKEGEWQEASESVAKINPEEAKKESFREIAQLQEAMTNKIKELVGEGKPVNPYFLEVSAVHRKLAESGVLSSQAVEALSMANKEYDTAGFIAPLAAAKKEAGKYVEGHRLGALRDVPQGALHIEHRAIPTLQDCESGWVRAGAFGSALNEEIDNFKIEQLGKEKEINLNQSEQKKGFAGLRDQVMMAKEDTFSRMMNWTEELPGPLGIVKQRYEAMKSRGEDVSNEFKRALGDRILSGELNSVLYQFKEQYQQHRDTETSEALRTVRCADLAGVVNPSEALDLERKLG